jgi:hypothetical protein
LDLKTRILRRRLGVMVRVVSHRLVAVYARSWKQRRLLLQVSHQSLAVVHQEEQEQEQELPNASKLFIQDRA